MIFPPIGKCFYCGHDPSDDFRILASAVRPALDPATREALEACWVYQDFAGFLNLTTDQEMVKDFADKGIPVNRVFVIDAKMKEALEAAAKACRAMPSIDRQWLKQNSDIMRPDQLAKAEAHAETWEAHAAAIEKLPEDK